MEEVPLDKLSQIAPPKVVKCWGFLVVESTYDRALLEELDKLAQLKAEKISHSALNFLFAPPEIEEPSLSDILLALANPVSPTLSQAVALTHAMKAPLTVITGPPGKGKTRIIVGLIVHHLPTGQSVLFSSKINRAVDAAVELAERLMGKGCILRTGNQQEIEKLQERVDELLERREWQKNGELLAEMRQTFPTSTSGRLIANNLIPSVRVEVNQLTEGISERCKWLNRMGKSLSRFGLRPVCPHHHGKRRLKRFFCSECWRRWRWEFSWRIRLGERRWAEFNDEWKKLERKFESLRKEIIPPLRSKLSYALWLKLNELLLQGRKDLEKLGSTSSDPDNSGRSERIAAFKCMAQLGFPIAVTSLSIGNNLPFETCFDTLIVDEASSCDPASLLPLLYRAKRVVIVGDPKQLDHVTQGRWK